MSDKKWYSLVAVLVLGSTLLAACATPTPTPIMQEVKVEVTKITEVEGETVVQEVIVTATPLPPPKEMRPNVLHVNPMEGEIPTIDPALASDTASIQMAAELGIGLTKLDEETLELHPGMAESWDISDDGLTYLFYVQQGVPWVRWDGQKVVEVLDCEGNVRYVTAHDFEYGIKRTGNPDTASDYAYVPAISIAGAEDVLYAEGWGDMSEEEKQALLDGVGATALDDYTLEVTFLTPAVFNLNIIGMWTSYAMPKWVIDGDECTEARSERWTEPGFHQSYGPYALEEWVHDSYIQLTKNPFWPGIDSVPVAQIEKIKVLSLGESAAFAEYEAGNMDVTKVPLPDLDRARADPTLSEQLYTAPYGCSYMYGFNSSKPPIDNVHFRRALSHAIMRQELIDNVTKGGQEPAQWFCRPGMAGCPTMETHPDTGIKTDPEAAKRELQIALDEMGYDSVDDLPEIILMHSTSESHKRIAEAVTEMWHETLGIRVLITNQERKVFFDTMHEDAPQIYRSGWCLDYPDANNFTREVFGRIPGEEHYALHWYNAEYDSLLTEAAVETDLATRQDLYAQAADILVYEDAAIAPVYWYTTIEVTQPWVNRTYSQHGHEAYEKWSLELELD